MGVAVCVVLVWRIPFFIHNIYQNRDFGLPLSNDYILIAKFYRKKKGQTPPHSSSELGAHSIPWSVVMEGAEGRSPSLCSLALAASSGP